MILTVTAAGRTRFYCVDSTGLSYLSTGSSRAYRFPNLQAAHRVRETPAFFDLLTFDGETVVAIQKERN
jgi:hypothetical protein